MPADAALIQILSASSCYVSRRASRSSSEATTRSERALSHRRSGKKYDILHLCHPARAYPHRRQRTIGRRRWSGPDRPIGGPAAASVTPDEPFSHDPVRPYRGRSDLMVSAANAERSDRFRRNGVECCIARDDVEVGG